jgi:cytochrome d ubiquinol oxidase subunit II
MTPIIDYETLRVIWWLLLGVLLIGFAMLDGFDMGVAVLMPYAARTDTERRVMINAIGPIWEGNQVWFILGGGAIFAAWPLIYATAFSGFYLAMLVILLALILRPVGFDYRNKIADPRWRRWWDVAMFVGGFVPALVFGVAVGNLLQGVPFRIDETMRSFYAGGLIGLLNPFGLLCGLVSVAMVAMHGAQYLQLKTVGKIADRARAAGAVAGVATIALFVVAGLIVLGMAGYRLGAPVPHDGPSNPLAKTVVREAGAWLRNFGANPWMWIAPALGVLGAAGAVVATWVRRPGPGFVLSALSILGIVATPGLAMFPFLMPSSTDPRSSLTVWDASSSQLTLFVMLIATVIFMPIIIAYTSWVYRVVKGPVTERYVEQNDHSLY